MMADTDQRDLENAGFTFLHVNSCNATRRGTISLKIVLIFFENRQSLRKITTAELLSNANF